MIFIISGMQAWTFYIIFVSQESKTNKNILMVEQAVSLFGIISFASVNDESHTIHCCSDLR